MNLHDRIRVQAALTQCRETGHPVRMVLECDGVPLRVLVSRVLDKAAVLAQREAMNAPPPH